jgi:hypothetical protein
MVPAVDDCALQRGTVISIRTPEQMARTLKNRRVISANIDFVHFIFGPP